MTVAELKALLDHVSDPQTEVLVRCQWEGDQPNGPVFAVQFMTEEYSHGEPAEHYVALECDQEVIPE